jgi:transcriptional regulator with XRE-family HTH domain
MDGEAMAAEARRLRTQEQLSVRQIQQRLGVTKVRLVEWLRGVPPPDWTRRPNAKDDLRARAVELRRSGWSVNDIAAELGVATSTAYQWVRHLPLDPDTERARQKREHSKLMTDAQWASYRERRDARRVTAHAAAAAVVGPLTDRDLLLLGAAIYWCEGAKAKPWRLDEAVQFVNSDPLLLELFLRFLETQGRDRMSLTYRVSIHESADHEAALDWWAERLGLPRERFRRTTLKRHTPKTNRRNTGAGYHGCLVINVPKGRELYWQIEGVMRGFRKRLGDSAGSAVSR